MALPFQLSGLTITGGLQLLAAGGTPPPTPGLIFSYNFSNSSSYSGSGTTVNDLSGNGYNLTLVNSPVFNGSDHGGSMTTVVTDKNQPNTGGSYMNTGTGVNLPYTNISGNNTLGDWSFSIVANIKNVGTTYAATGLWNNQLYGSGNPGAGATVQTVPGDYYLFYPGAYNSGGNYYSLVQGGTDYKNKIVLYDFVYTSIDKTCKLYINGSLADSKVAPFGFAATNVGFFFGAERSSSTSQVGSFADVIYYQMQAYDSALNSTAITAHYNSIKSQYGI